MEKGSIIGKLEFVLGKRWVAGKHKNLSSRTQATEFFMIIFYEAFATYHKKLRGLSPQANYTDRATASCRRS
jgi:hypothetical protein